MNWDIIAKLYIKMSQEQELLPFRSTWIDPWFLVVFMLLNL
jgi:hypothetical protein